MNTRVVMSSSALFLALVGLSLSFLPSELLALLGVSADGRVSLLFQIAGGALIGWAMVNWTARSLVIGGIYSRPLTLGNLVHFGSGSIALSKAVLVAGLQPLTVFLLIGYGLFALCFGYLVFGQGAACVAMPGRDPAA